MKTLSDPIARERARQLRKDGEAQTVIAKMLGRKPGTVWRWVKDIEITDDQRKKLRARKISTLCRKLGKKKEKLEARRLRQEEGISVCGIAKRLNVSQASVSLWVRDIILTEDQKINLEIRASHYRDLGHDACREKYYNLRNKYQENGRMMAKQKDPEFIAGIMLYWAEGSKSINQIKFTNSDVHMIKFFASFLRKFYKLDNDDLNICINCYTDIHNVEDIEKYWLESLELSKKCLGKTMINNVPISSKQTRKGKCPYGVCNIRVDKTEVIQSIYGAIQEFIGFENKKWIDIK